MRKPHIKLSGKWYPMPEGTDAAEWLHRGVMVGFFPVKPEGKKCKHPEDKLLMSLETGNISCAGCGKVLREKVTVKAARNMGKSKPMSELLSAGGGIRHGEIALISGKTNGWKQC